MLSFFEMQSLCKEIDPLLQKAVLISIYEIDKRKWILLFEKENKQIPLLISTSFPYHRFHLVSKKQASYSTSFTKHLEKKLQKTRLKKVEKLDSDRILKLTFEDKKKDLFLIVELFSKHPQVLVTSTDFKILESLEKASTSQYTPRVQKNALTYLLH